MALHEHPRSRSARPYSGSVNAVEFLVNGFKKGWGPFTVDLTDTIRSFTSVYQLLPSYRCLQGDGGAWLTSTSVDWTGSGLDQAGWLRRSRLQRDLRYVRRRAPGSGRRAGLRHPSGDRRLPAHHVGAGPVGHRREHQGARRCSCAPTARTAATAPSPKVSASPHELLDGIPAGGVHEPAARVAAERRPGARPRRRAAASYAARAGRRLSGRRHVGRPGGRGRDDRGAAGGPGAQRRRPPASSRRSSRWPAVRPGDAPADPGCRRLAGGSRRDDLPEGDYRVTVGGAGTHPVTDVVERRRRGHDRLVRDVYGHSPGPRRSTSST